jgi:hypothetical protein
MFYLPRFISDARIGVFSRSTNNMDGEQIIQNQETEPQRTTGLDTKKKIIIGVAAAIFLAALAFVSYKIGTQNASTGPSPTPSPSLSDSLDFPTMTEESTPTASVSGTITATPKTSLTPSPTPIIKSKTLSSSAELDGFRSSNNGGNNALEIRAGRNSNLVSRGFVSFDLSSLPSGIQIQNANLRLYQVNTEGGPYSVGGALKVDHLTYGNSLDSADYASPALLSSFVTLTENNVVEWKDADVTDEVKDDIANARSQSQFRIHFTTEVTGGDIHGDYAYFEAADNTEGTGHTPQLVVKYY